MSAQKNNLKANLIKEFKRFEDHLNGSTPSALKDIKKDALKHFEKLGFPNRKNEEWKYTNVDPVTKIDFRQDFSLDTKSIHEKDIRGLLIPKLDENVLVLVNGIYSERLSNLKSISGKVHVCSLEDAQKKYPDICNVHFTKYADYRTNGFTALNTAFACNGLFIYVPNGVQIKEPVVLLNIFDTRKPNLLFQHRNLFVTGENSAFSIIELNHIIGNNNGFSNVVREVVVGENSEFGLINIQNEGSKNFSIGTTQVYQEVHSKFNSTTISWEGRIIRNDLNSSLNGENCECNFDGVFVLSDNQHVDNHTLVDHSVPNCESNEFYKGILDDNSTGVFNGKIIVRKDAQKTNAYQSNKNILLTKTATMNSKPQLEIFADDVRCSHGATTGQLNEDELFYLRSRGIDEKEARITLLYAFASEIIQKIRIEPLRNYLLDMLHNKLRKFSI